ncbi:MAG: hypothetical protein FWD74_01235 [Actinomycetia bacterium]|nr:hypothetical protein [Actinomycetes bacterium]
MIAFLVALVVVVARAPWHPESMAASLATAPESAPAAPVAATTPASSGQVATSASGGNLGGGPQPLRCVVPMPASWRRAMGTPVQMPGVATHSPYAEIGSWPIAISATGEVLAFTTARGENGQVVLVTPERTTRVLYGLPPMWDTLPAKFARPDFPTGPYVGAGAVDAKWAVFAVLFDMGEHAGSNVNEGIVAIDLNSGAAIIVREPLRMDELGAVAISDPVLWNGAVYWSETRGSRLFDGMSYHYNGASDVFRLDLATGARSTVAAGARLSRDYLGHVYWPAVVGDAVMWRTADGKAHWTGGQPPSEDSPLTQLRADSTFVQDGSAYAWTAAADSGDPGTQDEIYLVTPQTPEPRLIYQVPSDAYPGGSVYLSALSGQYLVFRGYSDDNDGSATVVLNLNTGAGVELDPDSGLTGIASGGVIAFTWDNGNGTDKFAVTRDRELPEVTC